MIKIQLSKEVERKHIQYFEMKIIPKLIDSRSKPYSYDSHELVKILKKDSLYIKKKFIKQHNHFVGFVKNKYITFATGKPSDFKKIKTEIDKLFPLIIEMIGSEYKNGENQTYREYLYNLFGYEGFKVKDLYYYIKKKAEKNTKRKQYCKAVKEEIANILITNYPKLNKEIKDRLLPVGRHLNAEEYIKQFRELTEINITMNNFKQIDIFAEEWNDYSFIMESGVRVCPYCNRQYITPVFSDSGKMRADIDHFLPKSKYPYFSMSLYNLVPVCKACNQSLKGSKEFELDDINPYVYSLDDYFKFSVNTVSSEISIGKNQLKINEIEKHLNTFKIEALYNYHRNQVDELIKKRIAYPESYIEKLYKENMDSFKAVEDLKQLIIGYVKDKSKLNDEAFLKLRRDIAEQLGFLDSKIDADQIEKLKSIIQTRNIP